MIVLWLQIKKNLFRIFPRWGKVFWFSFFCLVLLAGWYLGFKRSQTRLEVKQMETIKITSPAFLDQQRIPDKYTCQGEDVNPALEFSNVPSGCQSLALIVDDPDAPGGVWTHWLVFNIDPSLVRVEENSVPLKAIQGRNSFGHNQWGGPCPPPGPVHHYRFKIYALKEKLNLSSTADQSELEKAMEGKILGFGQLIGTFSR